MIRAPFSLEVITLGRFALRRYEEQVSGGNWKRRKVCELFKLLISAEQHRLHREQVQEILWPASASEQATSSFGKTLYLLRRALEPALATGRGASSTYVVLDHDSLVLLPDHMQIDADLFEAWARQLQARLRNHTPEEHDERERSLLLDEFDHALDLYGGDYLPDDLYEDWAQRRRERLRRLHAWLLEQAAELAIANGMGTRACDYLLSALECNPIDEQTRRRLMLVYARMGRRGEALHQFQHLREALLTELRADPLPETVELYQAIQAGSIAADLAYSRPQPMSGASEEQATLSSLPVRAHAHSDEQAGFQRAGQTMQTAQSARVAVAELPPEPMSQGRRELVTRTWLMGETTTLVGREEEMQRLQRAFVQVCSGHIFAISGETGIGRTRLADEFARWAETSRRALVLRGYCYEMDGALPYQPIAGAINTYVRTCTPRQLRCLPHNSLGDLAGIAPELRARLPNLPLPATQTPEMERSNLYHAVSSYLATLAAERSLMIILDDLQWADCATMHLLGYLTAQAINPAQSTDASPFYLLLYRSDEVDELHPLRRLLATLTHACPLEEIHLKRLTEDAVRQWLTDLAGQTVEASFAKEIYAYSEGNPFFISETLHALAQVGSIDRQKERGEPGQSTVRVDELALPQRVRQLIERRLVRASPECRAVLERAAVLGRQCSSALLCRASQLAEETIAQHLDEAIRLHILAPISNKNAPASAQRQAGRDCDLAFTHGRIRQALYHWLNPLRRRTLHRQAAQAIEAHYAAHLEPYYYQLAHHYRMAEDYTRAIDYFLKAESQPAP
jgi:DNA-binding SARP family transcriptional activator